MAITAGGRQAPSGRDPPRESRQSCSPEGTEGEHRLSQTPDNCFGFCCVFFRQRCLRDLSSPTRD